MPKPENLPKIGEQFYNFTLNHVFPLKDIDSTGLVFTHNTTGLTLIYIASDDTNRSFTIAYRTDPLDEKGIPHVFEHASLEGSEKYPSTEIFFPLASQSYNSFMNAGTYGNMTIFEVASLSEPQLSKLADFVLSGVFNPLLKSEPRIMDKEAWHYVLKDKDAPITISGVVYSELMGVLTNNLESYYVTLRTLFPGCATAHNVGGEPEDIRTISYEELISFHDKYYTPSNALICLYGRLDWKAFLEQIDTDYLAKETTAPVPFQRPTVPPVTKTQHCVSYFPAEKGTVKETDTIIHYAFALNDMDVYDYSGFALLLNTITDESSILMKRLKDALPSATIETRLTNEESKPFLLFIANGVKAEDEGLFISTIDSSLATICKEGISPKTFKAVKKSKDLSLRLSPEAQDIGINTSIEISTQWAAFNQIDAYPDTRRAVETLTKADAEALLREYLVDNKHRAITVNIPKAGLAEQKTTELTTKLSAYKASLSEEEINALVKKTQEFEAWSTKKCDPDIIAPLLPLTPKMLPEEIPHHDITKKKVNGVTYLTAEACVNDIYSSSILLDASVYPLEDVQDITTFLWLLGQLETKDHTRAELSTLLTSNLPSLSTSLNASEMIPDGKPLFSTVISWVGSKEDTPLSVALLKEMLTSTDFSNESLIKGLLRQRITAFENAIENSPQDVIMQQLEAQVLESKAFESYISAFDYQDYLNTLLSLPWDEFISRMQKAQDTIMNKTSSQVLIAGNKDSISALEKELIPFFASFAAKSQPKTDFSSLLKAKEDIAIANNSNVQMNILLAGRKGNYSGKDAIISQYVGENYLINILRNQKGAYGATSSLSPLVMFMRSYRDPELENTYTIFTSVPDYLASSSLDQKTVDNYIMGTYSYLYMPKGPLTSAYGALSDYIVGINEEMRRTWLKEAKDTRVSDIRNAKVLYEELLKNGSKGSSGRISRLKENAALFDRIITNKTP